MAKVQSKYQGKEGIYFIVNPSGAVHDCTREHVTMRLKTLGFRLATDAEIEQFQETKIQRFQTPIGEPWSPEPIVEPWVPDAEKAEDGPLATEAAALLAKEKGIDLKKVKASGANGQILKADVTAAVTAAVEARDQ